MAWYTPLLWYLVGFGLGILIFLAGPVLIGPSLPRSAANRIAAYYDGLAMRTAGRLLLVRRLIGSYVPAPSTFDGEKGGERVKLDGEEHHFFDDLGLMGTWHNRPFGTVLEGLGVIGDPFLASMYDYEAQRRDSGDWLTEDEDGNLQYEPDVEIPEMRMLAELRNLQDIVPGELGSKDPSTAETLFEKSQRLFGKPKTTDVMLLVIAWGIGLGGFIILSYFTGAGGMNAPDLPALPAVMYPW